MNPRKRQLLSKLFYATKDHLTIVRNIENIMEWMARTDTSVYRHVRHGTFLIPATDRILDRQAMLASARTSPPPPCALSKPKPPPATSSRWTARNGCRAWKPSRLRPKAEFNANGQVRHTQGFVKLALFCLVDWSL